MKHRLLTCLLLLPLLCLAQSQTKENCIRVSTFLNAAGTDSITDITYYDELGRESTTFTQIELGDVCITSIRSSSPVYHYKLKDHLGSVRMVMGTNGSVSGGSNYYPYGGDFTTYNKSLWGYRFCDRRMDRVYGLDLYDSQARFYDPEIGRFDTQDGKSENDYAVSPYLYCLANPVNTLDDDGNSAWSKIAKIGFRVGKTVAKQGISALTKTATYAEAVSDITDDIKTVGNGKASTTDRIMAGVSLASEFLPISIRDAKNAAKIAKNTSNYSKELFCSTKETLKAQAKGPKIPSKTLWNSKEKNYAHIDLENNAQSKRVGQIHYQDKNGKFYYDEKTKKFYCCPIKPTCHDFVSVSCCK